MAARWTTLPPMAAPPDNKSEPFGPYLLLRPLGRGGMGVVYVARSRRTDHPILAVKRLRADAAQVPSFRERFDHECALALRLRHPRVVHALDAGEVDGVPYVASELIAGQDIGAIAERLSQEGRGAPIKVAIRVVIDMLAALDYVHQAHEPTGRPLQLVHRDVTPGNVLVGYDGISRLADFGLAKSFLTEQLQLTVTGTILGTPKFLAPEVALGESAGPRSDLYGLGAVIYRLLVGRGPYDGDAREALEGVLSGPPRAIDTLRPDLPAWFVDTVKRLMARDPQDRPSSARIAGMHLVKEARRADALLPRNRVGQWLKDLFSEEWNRASDNMKRDLAVDVSLVPAGEGTRVLKAANAPLKAPDVAATAGDEPFDYDGLTLQPLDIEHEVATKSPEEQTWRPDPHGSPKPWRPDPAALTEVGPMGDDPTRQPALRDAPEESNLDGPTHLWSEAAPPPKVIAPNPAAPTMTAAPSGAERSTTQRLFRFDGWRPWIALAAVAMAAAIIGGLLGYGLRQRHPDPPRRTVALIERLGAAKRSAAQLRRNGVVVPSTVDQRIANVQRNLLKEENIVRAQLELQDVELTLEALTGRRQLPKGDL